MVEVYNEIYLIWTFSIKTFSRKYKLWVCNKQYVDENPSYYYLKINTNLYVDAAIENSCYGRYSNDNKDRGSKILQDPWTGMTNKQIDIEYAKLIAW